ncbi:pilus assembly protein N-terminal domain-containing protein [Methyloceanibacter sp.]|uniref:pilus assembly protein N-terminal domain-containing protein n=1 Tax=Methyloceanibacter sp. TaxID=1965321 RepID=UPI002D227E44|nr:pilus assembly protein N-terminal domain-containing protein [Methyloceanibacter sp.]HZP09504.1 pilus assembly protein N-terminal domain-containing protein [Methyloceanibacter sp.]
MGEAHETGDSRIMTLEQKPKRAMPALLVAAALAAGSASPGRAADNDNDIDVLVDQASLVKLDRPASEIVVGNPSIADVAVQSSKVLIITGKSFGETNLIVLDSDGKAIVSKRLTVSEPRIGLVTVYRGTGRQTVHCNPNCTPPLVIGDAPDYFESIAKQIKSKQSISQSSAEGTKQSE